MNKETIEKRIADLKTRQQALTAEFSACEGAIQDCLFWISELEKPEKKEKKNG